LVVAAKVISQSAKQRRIITAMKCDRPRSFGFVNGQSVGFIGRMRRFDPVRTTQ